MFHFIEHIVSMFLHALEQRRAVARTRRELQGLDDQALRDVGLSHRAVAEGTNGGRDDKPSRMRLITRF